MKKYFSLLLLNFTQPKSYKKWILLPKKQVFGFFALTMVLLGLIQGTIFSLFQVPEFSVQLQESVDSAKNAYPQDLVINWDASKLQLLPEEKYGKSQFDLSSIPLLKEAFEKGPRIIHYSSSDMTSEETFALLQEESTMFSLEPHTVSFFGDSEKTLSQPLTDVIGTTPFTLQASDLPYLVEGTKKAIIGWTPKIQLFIPFVAAFGMLFGETVISVFSASLLWLFTRFTKVPETWGQAWRLTLAVLVTANIIHTIALYLSPQNAYTIKETSFWLLSAFILLSWKIPALIVQEKN